MNIYPKFKKSHYQIKIIIQKNGHILKGDNHQFSPSTSIYEQLYNVNSI
jgi:hypothetical protein